MESPVVESQGAKRKRTPVDDPVSRPNPASGGGAGGMINYLVKSKSEKLKLIEGDTESFSDILGLIDDYEGTSKYSSSFLALQNYFRLSKPS
jgi:hypothetical protein